MALVVCVVLTLCFFGQASWQLELWEQILAEQADPASKPLTSLAFESATPLAQYCHVLHELLNNVPKEVLDTELFFRRTRHLVVIALVSYHRLQPANLETALANMLSSRYAPDYACLAVRNDSNLFEPALSAIVQKASAEDATSSNLLLRSGLSQSLLQLADLMPGYSDAIRDRLFSAQVLSDVWWALVKRLEPDQVLASLSSTLEKCDKSIQAWWFATAEEAFFTDLWRCLVGIVQQQQQQRGRRAAPETQRQLLQCFAAVCLCTQPGDERRNTLASLIGTLAEGCVDGLTTRAFVALCILVTGLAVGSSAAQTVGQHFAEALKQSKLCQVYVVACLVYSRVDELKAFGQRALKLPEFGLSPSALQALQKQHTQHVTPNSLMRELQQALAEPLRHHETEDGAPYPGDEIDCVLLFLQLRLFLDTRTDPHGIMLRCIQNATCPPHPKLLDCLQAWMACVVRSWEQPRAGATGARQFFRPVLPHEARAAFHATNWAVAIKHELVPYLSRQQQLVAESGAAATSSWHSLITAYGLDPTCTEDFTHHECQEFARALKNSREEDEGAACQPQDEVFKCFDRHVWASIACVYATLLLRSVLAESAFVGMFPFELEFSELPIRRALQTVSVVAQLCPAAADWLQAMLQQVAAHCPQHLCPERCFLFDPFRALQHLPAAETQTEKGDMLPPDEPIDRHDLFLATVGCADEYASRFLERSCQPAVDTALRGDCFAETSHIAQRWIMYHALHAHPDQFELETFNLFLRACELPHLHAIPSYDLLVREPCVLFRLPLPLQMQPWVLRILLVILRSSMERTASDASAALRRQKTAFESFSEAARVRSKLAMIEQLPAELFLALTDSVVIRCLTELAFRIQENVQLLSDRNGTAYFALFESYQLVLGALRFYLCIRAELPELLLAQSLAREHTRLLFRISPDMRRAAGVVLAAVQNMSLQEHPEEVLYQADAVLLYHDEVKLVERLCTTLSSILVSVVTDILPHYCRQEALQEAIVGVLDTLAAKSPLHLLKLRERLSTPILACLPRRVSANLHSELDRLCGEIRAEVLKLAPSDTDEATEARHLANGTEKQPARKRPRS